MALVVLLAMCSVAPVTQWIECPPAKRDVADSSPARRTIFTTIRW